MIIPPLNLSTVSKEMLVNDMTIFAVSKYILSIIHYKKKYEGKGMGGLICRFVRCEDHFESENCG